MSTLRQKKRGTSCSSKRSLASRAETSVVTPSPRSLPPTLTTLGRWASRSSPITRTFASSSDAGSSPRDSSTTMYTTGPRRGFMRYRQRPASRRLNSVPKVQLLGAPEIVTTNSALQRCASSASWVNPSRVCTPFIFQHCAVPLRPANNQLFPSPDFPGIISQEDDWTEPSRRVCKAAAT